MPEAIERKHRFATVQEVADYIRLSRPTIYRLLREGKIPSRLVGGSRRIDWADVDRYLDECAAGL